jgi:hypothetical protein
MNTNISVALPYEGDSTKRILGERLQVFSTNSLFYDDKWIMDKAKRSGGENISDYTLYFTTIPLKYRDIFKWYALLRLGKAGVRNLVASMNSYAHFFRYLVNEHDSVSLFDINSALIKDFELYIKTLSLAKSTKEGIWSCSRMFFLTMADWDDMPNKTVFGRYNPFARKKSDLKIEGKYMPDFVCNQLDRLFYENDNIKNQDKLAYWLMRAIPSRVTEITSMKIDCLKPALYNDTLVILIPTWKQNGGNYQPEIRLIYIKPEGDFESYLIDLIQKQQEVARMLQNKVVDKGYLFTYTPWGENKAKILDEGAINRAFRRICKNENIIDETGNVYYFTTHQLRHNGITDRIDAGFSFIEIRDMTNHKGNSMIWNSYYHVNKEKTLKRQEELFDKVNSNQSLSRPIYFRGRILNMDTGVEEQILKNIRAYKIMDGNENIGVCADITGCKSKMFECLGCDYFVPNAEDIEYFNNQIAIWTEKANLFRNKKQAYEKAIYNLELHKKLVERIRLQTNLLNNEVKG